MSKTTAHQRYRNKDGDIVPGVTTILGILAKPALIHWAWDLGMKQQDYRKVRDQAGGIGTICHAMVEADIKGQRIDLSEYARADIDKAETAYLAWLEWRKQNVVEFVASELPLVHDTWGFGGTLDAIARHDGELWLIDIKTSKDVYDEMIAQVAAYQHLYQGNLAIPIHQVHIIRLDKEDGIPTDHLIPERKLQAGWKVFLGCLEAYRGLKEMK